MVQLTLKVLLFVSLLCQPLILQKSSPYQLLIVILNVMMLALERKYALDKIIIIEECRESFLFYL